MMKEWLVTLKGVDGDAPAYLGIKARTSQSAMNKARRHINQKYNRRAPQLRPFVAEIQFIPYWRDAETQINQAIKLIVDMIKDSELTTTRLKATRQDLVNRLWGIRRIGEQ